jgi:DNA-directed RNA polymerase subunit RPC12/RpoP
MVIKMVEKKVKCWHCGREINKSEAFEEEIDYNELRYICAICWLKLNS